jgi:xanthine dehydrogenase/oxidase
VYDCGISLNPALDIGQIEGGFIMGLGYFLQESVEYDELGNLISNGTWEYKPPLASDIPSVFNVTLLANTPNPSGILRSKAVGEPPCVISNSVYFATKSAIASARRDSPKSWDASTATATDFELPVPSTIDVRHLACQCIPSRYVMPN